MAPRHTQGCGGGGHVLRRHIPRAQQTKNSCVGLVFPPPAYAGIRPTLFLFGFPADALNSHSSFINNGPATDGPSGGLRTSGGRSLSRGNGSSQKPPGASKGLRGLQKFRHLFASFLGSRLANLEISAFPGHLWGRPGQRRPQAQKAKDAGFRVYLSSSESQKRRRGPLGAAPAPAPGGAAHALNHSLGLHSSSKRWCEWLSI